MRILQILPELNVGGVETGTVDFAKYLVKEGHQAVVVSNGGVLVEELKKSGVRHYVLPVHKKSIWTAWRCVKDLADIITTERIDVVHARSRVPAWIAYFACRRTKTAFITTCHGYYGNHFFSRVMGWPKLVIVPSEVIGRHMIDDFGVFPENIRRIPRSVDLTKYQTDNITKLPSECVISIIGRITPLKGHKYFLKAMAKVIRSVPYAKIWIIGDAPARKSVYREDLELLVKRLGLSDYVEFLGNRRDIPQLLAKTDVLVLSTITEEAFGRVILEAQAAGVPVVATQVGGVVEIIDDQETGLLVLPKDPEAMAQAVLRLLRDKPLREKLVRAARLKLKKEFTLEHMARRTLDVYSELLTMMNILVIKLSALGDVILITAALKALKQRFPHAKIYCVVNKDFRTVLQRCPYIDDLIVFDDKGRDRGWWGLFRFSRKLQKYKFDLSLDLQNNKKSHLISFLSFPMDSYGFDNGKLSWLLKHKVRMPPDPMPPVDHQFVLLKKLGIEPPEKNRLELWLSRQEKESVQQLLESEWLGNTTQIVGINLSASEQWLTKNWPVSHIAQLCELLESEGWRVLLTGTLKDRPVLQELLGRTKAKPASFVGKTDIMQLAAIIKRCRVYITPDSAPMHLAAAVGTPFIALFGPTDSARHLPPAERCIVIQRDLACSPCYSTYCKVATHECMRDISAQEVFAKIKQVVSVKRQKEALP